MNTNLLLPDAKFLKGKMFVFEGIDYSGKSTSIKLLKDYIEREYNDVPVTVIADLDSTPLGKSVRKIIKDERIKMDVNSEMLLMLAARAALVKNVILPLLNKGHMLLCDRFDVSTHVYQSHEDKEKDKGLNQITWLIQEMLNISERWRVDSDYDYGDNRLRRGNIDSYDFYFKISLETYLKRRGDSKPDDTFESRGKAFYKRIIQRYDDWYTADVSALTPTNNPFTIVDETDVDDQLTGDVIPAILLDNYTRHINMGNIGGGWK